MPRPFLIFSQSDYFIQIVVLYNRVFNYFKRHVYYVSINSFIYYVSKNNFLEQHVYNNMMFTSLILDWVIFGMSWKI